MMGLEDVRAIAAEMYAEGSRLQGRGLGPLAIKLRAWAGSLQTFVGDEEWRGTLRGKVESERE